MRKRREKRNWRWKRPAGPLAAVCLALVVHFGGAWAAPADEGSGSDVERSWQGPDNRTLPFQTEEQVLDFLRTAKVVSSKRIGKGINNPRKLLLEKDGVTAHAVFRDVRVEKFRKTAAARRDLFRDDALFEVAAYKLSRLLGMDCIPPTVERSLYGKRGSLQLWVERAMTESKRKEKALEAPDHRRLQLQLQHMRVFDSLIHNDDRNQGNMLFDGSWQLWLIDHTRAFRRDGDLTANEPVWFCHSLVWQRLRTIDDETLRGTLEPYLYPKELKGLLDRRRLLVARIEDLIAQRGEEIVLFDWDGPASPPVDASLVALSH